MSPGRLLFGVLPWYSVLVVAGMTVAILLAQREEKRMALPRDTMIDLALWLLPIGVLGARVYYVVFSWDNYAADPLSALYIWEGGLAIYGGLIAGAVTAVVFAKRRRLSIVTLLDAIAPGVALAQAIGRWGNFFNMEAYGLPVTDAFWQFFPAAVLIPESGGNVWHMATFFYESCWDLLTFCFLWRGRAKRGGSGRTVLWYVLLYGAGRQLIEPLRMDSLLAGNARVSQWLALGLCAAALALLIARCRPEIKRVLPPLLIALAVTVLLILYATEGLRLLWAACMIVCGLMTEQSGNALRGEKASCLPEL